MRYLTSYGGVWRLANTAYARFVQDVAAGKDWDLDDYGTRVTSNLINVTDFNQKEAKIQLAYNLASCRGCGEPLTYKCKHGICKGCGNCVECETRDRHAEQYLDRETL